MPTLPSLGDPEVSVFELWNVYQQDHMKIVRLYVGITPNCFNIENFQLPSTSPKESINQSPLRASLWGIEPPYVLCVCPGPPSSYFLQGVNCQLLVQPNRRLRIGGTCTSHFPCSPVSTISTSLKLVPILSILFFSFFQLS